MVTYFYILFYKLKKKKEKEKKNTHKTKEDFSFELIGEIFQQQTRTYF